MKKSIAMVLATLMAASCLLVGCGSKNPTSSNPTSDSSVSNTDETATGETATGENAASAAAADSEAASEEPSEQVEPVDMSDNYSAGLNNKGMYKNVKATKIVTLPEKYKEIPVPQSVLDEGKEETVDELMEQIRQLYGEKSEVQRAAQMGDMVVIDYDGTINGDSFSGNRGTDTEVILGQGKFVEGFEEQLAGHFTNEKFEIHVTFPADYPDVTNANGDTIVLAGQDVVFAITLKKVIELSLNDAAVQAFVADYNWSNDESGASISTVDGMESYYGKLIEDDNRWSYVVQYMTENSIISEIPQQLIDDQKATYHQELVAGSAASGITTDEYLASLGYESEEAWMAEMEESITNSVKSYLVFQAVAEKEKISVKESDVDDYFNGDTLSKNQAISYYGKEFLYQSLLYEKVGDWLCEHAVTA